ncbi:MAG: hypothetical protein RBT45_07895, partial [Acholeplasmataceae bacterium]|nr:hypothetical protein [Acholeplasmataceae bacterium]
ILNKFNVIDDVDGTNVTKVWTTNLYNQTIIPGVYHMQLTTKDLSNNTSRHSIYIHVIDNQAPQFEENDLIISRETHETMTNEEIIDWFRDLAANQGLDISHVRIIYNEYELADKKEGAYYVYLSYTSNDIEKTARILMQVSKNNVPSEIIYYGIGLIILVSGLGMYLIKKKKR